MQDYSRASPHINLAVTDHLAVAVLDKRPYVINHEKNENYVATVRLPTALSRMTGNSKYDNLLTLPTESKQPLAREVADAFVKSLSTTGASVFPINTTPLMTDNSIIEIAKNQHVEKVIVLNLLDWMTNTNYDTSNLIYDISLSVYDLQGNKLATKRLHGTDYLGKEILVGNYSIATDLAPIALQNKIEELFSGDVSLTLSQHQNLSIQKPSTEKLNRESHQLDAQKLPEALSTPKTENQANTLTTVISDTTEQSTEIKITKSGGVYTIPALLNGVLQINFIIDSGASDVSISPEVFLTLIKTETIEKQDWRPSQLYKLADGSIVNNQRFILKELKIGSRILRNIPCSVSNSISAMLLGQSALEKLGSYSIDYDNQVLKFKKNPPGVECYSDLDCAENYHCRSKKTQGTECRAVK